MRIISGAKRSIERNINKSLVTQTNARNLARMAQVNNWNAAEQKDLLSSFNYLNKLFIPKIPSLFEIKKTVDKISRTYGSDVLAYSGLPKKELSIVNDIYRQLHEERSLASICSIHIME